MSKPYTHAENSVKQFGGKISDYLPIHEFMDSSKASMSDNRHLALTHNSWFIQTVMDRIFGQAIQNSDGRMIPVRDISEQHCFEDFGNNILPSAQDFLQFLTPQPWMSGEGGTPPSRQVVSPAASYRLAIDGNTERAHLVSIPASLYDREICFTGHEMRFFERPITQDFLNLNPCPKGERDTNMNQSAMLDYPREFTCTGCGVFVFEGALKEEIAKCSIEIYRYGKMDKSITLNLADFPSFDESKASSILLKTKHVEGNRRIPDNKLPDDAVFPLPHQQWFKIVPGEPFGVILRWPKSYPKQTRVAITVALSGEMKIPEYKERGERMAM